MDLITVILTLAVIITRGIRSAKFGIAFKRFLLLSHQHSEMLPPLKLESKDCGKLSVTQPQIVWVRSNFVQSLNTWHPILYKQRVRSSFAKTFV